MNRSTFLIIINWNATCVSTSRCLIKTPFITERQTLPLHFFLKKWMGDYKCIKLLGFMKPGSEAKCNFLSLESDAPWLPPLFLTGECSQSIVAVTVILCCQENPVSLAEDNGATGNFQVFNTKEACWGIQASGMSSSLVLYTQACRRSLLDLQPLGKLTNSLCITYSF